MLIEGPSLQTRHRHRLIAVDLLLTRFKPGDIHRAQTRIEVKVQLGFGASLAIAQARKLFRIAEYKMKTPRSKLRGIKRKITLNLLEASFGESHPKRLNFNIAGLVTEK